MTQPKVDGRAESGPARLFLIEPPNIKPPVDCHSESSAATLAGRGPVEESVFLRIAHVGTAALGCPAEQSAAVVYSGTDCVARALLPAKARGGASGEGFVDRTRRLGLSREAL